MKDYAKRPRPQKYHLDNGNGLLLFCLLCAIFFLVFVTYHFFHTRTQPVSVAIETPPLKQKIIEKLAEKTTHQTHHQKTVAVKKTKTTVVADNQPKYDFYKLLPKMTVVIPSDDQLTPTVLAKQKTMPHTASSYYLLQVASLASSVDAKEVQNTLKNGGYSAFIQRYQGSDHLIWYRVMVGPIQNLKTAESQQNKLYAHQMMAMLLKVR